MFDKDLAPLTRSDRLRCERMVEKAVSELLAAHADNSPDVNKIILKCATLSSVFKFAALLRQETAAKD